VEVSGQLRTAVSLSQDKELLITTEQEAGWAPEPVQTLLRRENLLPLPGINPDHPAHGLVAVPMLHMLQFEPDKLIFQFV
jgi:hypothetical protein